MLSKCYADRAALLNSHDAHWLQHCVCLHFLHLVMNLIGLGVVLYCKLGTEYSSMNKDAACLVRVSVQLSFKVFMIDQHPRSVPEA